MAKAFKALDAAHKAFCKAKSAEEKEHALKIYHVRQAEYLMTLGNEDWVAMSRLPCHLRAGAARLMLHPPTVQVRVPLLPLREMEAAGFDLSVIAGKAIADTYKAWKKGKIPTSTHKSDPDPQK